MKILYIGDLHIRDVANEVDQIYSNRLLERAKEADLVFICGDITDAGRPEQYERFKQLYFSIKDKSIVIRGNHDMGNYMEAMQSWFPKDIDIHFHPGEYPVWVWQTAWFEMLKANTKCFAYQQSLPEPYNRQAQPPVVVVYDGVGPYFYFEKEGIRFIVLDSATHLLGETQQQWLKETIDSSKLPIIIQLHENILPGGSYEETCCLLWDAQPLRQYLIHNDKVLGVFAAHLHFNRAWNWNGKKIVLTGAYGESRFVEVENGKITYIEPLDNYARKNFPECYKTLLDENPLDLHYWCPDKVLANNTFWVRKSSGFWDDAFQSKTHWGWYNPDGLGGLVWSIPPEFLPEQEVWFSVNFRSTTPWSLVLEENGKEIVVDKGDAGENIIATGFFGKGPVRPFYNVILKQEAPALGHATCYMALHYTPKPEFRLYP